MIEIKVTHDVAASIAEISKNTDLTDDAVANIAATMGMGLCSLRRETLQSGGEGEAGQPEGTGRGQRLQLFPEARQP